MGNWWDDRGEKIQDAQLDLNQTVGRLTAKSSQLLIVNTAISKVLTDQRRILLWAARHTQATDQHSGTGKIGKFSEQQNLLEKQQQDINKANQDCWRQGITQSRRSSWSAA